MISIEIHLIIAGNTETNDLFVCLINHSGANGQWSTSEFSFPFYRSLLSKYWLISSVEPEVPLQPRASCTVPGYPQKKGMVTHF